MDERGYRGLSWESSYHLQYGFPGEKDKCVRSPSSSHQVRQKHFSPFPLAPVREGHPRSWPSHHQWQKEMTLRSPQPGRAQQQGGGGQRQRERESEKVVTMERLGLPGPFGISTPELEDECLSTNDSARFPNE